MSTTDDNPRPEAGFFTTIRSWGISRGEHGVFGGVIEGVGNRIGLDRVAARLIALFLIFISGGLLLALYAAAWALLPDRQGRIILQDFGRGTPNVGALLMIGLFALIGSNSGPNAWFRSRDVGSAPFSFIWGLFTFAVIVGTIVFIVWVVSRGRSKPRVQDPDAVYAVPPAPKPGRGAAAAGSSPAAARRSPTATAPSSPGSAGDNGTTPPPAPAALPAMPPRPRTPGPGSAIYLLVLSAFVLSAAAVWGLDHEGRLSVSPASAWFAVAVVIVGVAIVLVGAVGRRIGFLGFLATTLILGWAVGLAVPSGLDFASKRVTFTIDGTTHTIGAGRGWYDTSSSGVDCASYRSDAAAVANAPRITVADGETDVTVTSATAVITVPNNASLQFEAEGDVTGSLSIQSLDITCDFDRAEGTLYAILGTGDLVTIHLTNEHSTVAIEELS